MSKLPDDLRQSALRAAERAWHEGWDGQPAPSIRQALVDAVAAALAAERKRCAAIARAEAETSEVGSRLAMIGRIASAIEEGSQP